jgi:hypothetical protein
LRGAIIPGLGNKAAYWGCLIITWWINKIIDGDGEHIFLIILAFSCSWIKFASFNDNILILSIELINCFVWLSILVNEHSC